MSQLNQTITVIGLGSVGQVVLALFNTLPNFTLLQALSRQSTTPTFLTTHCKNLVIKQSIDALRPSDLFFLAVPDDAINHVAQQLLSAGLLQAHTGLVHFSGAHPAMLLDVGIGKTLSMHPIKSFAQVETCFEQIAGTVITLEGDASLAKMMATAWRALGCYPVSLAAEHKSIYHAANVFVSNFIIGNIAAAITCYQQAGFGTEYIASIISSLIEQACTNAITLGTNSALTGPVRRGDTTTVNAHIQALKRQCPQWYASYVSQSKACLHIARNEMDKKDYDAMRHLLSDDEHR